MKYWQYIVTFIFLLGCSQEPAPDDSYFICQNDYREETDLDIDTLTASDSTVLVVLPETLIVVEDSLNGSYSMEDSLILLADTLASDIDSLLPVDPPAAWRFVEIEIQGSLYQSLGAVTDVESDILGAHCVRNLVWEMNPWRDFIAGDTVRIIYTTEVLPRENMVVAFEYIPVEGSSNHSFSGYVFTKTGDNWPSVWRSDGSELVELLDRSPIRTYEEITSVFGEPRGNHVHQGVDFKAPLETPVYSVTGGTVERTNWNTAYNGYCIEIDFGGYSELFLHLYSINSGVVAGAQIDPGEQVGTVGNTGVSTAPHLHYQINGPDDYAIDPYLYFSSHRRALNGNDMVRFQEQMNLCHQLMGD